MKKALALLLAAVLCLGCPAFAAAEDAGSPEDFWLTPSDVYQPAISQLALTVSELCYTPVPQLLFMAAYGYVKVGDWNMRRSPEDTRHVVGYALFQKALADGRTAVVLGVRGTAEGEWPLNMDLMPSGNYESPWSENFYLAARDILDTQADFLAGLRNPVFLVTGHSRGAAVANILGALLTDRFGADNVYAYTFATPRTVRGDIPDYLNIFNIINPCDLVTYLPLPQWGFVRFGRDLILPTETAGAADRLAVNAAYEKRLDKLGEDIHLSLPSAMLDAWCEAMAGLMPTVREGYSVPHALNHPGIVGENEPGMAGWELIKTLISAVLKGDMHHIQLLVDTVTVQDNDFAVPARAILDLMAAGGAAAVGSAHMPATYGAWLTVLRPEF